MTRCFVDADLERLGRRAATAAMRGFLEAVSRGETLSPPRLSVPVGSRTLVFTCGGAPERGFVGFRAYSTGAGTRREGAPSQISALIDAQTGELTATAVGDAFGAWRTAAIGAVAFEEATEPVRSALDVAVFGAGLQAHHHARAWAATGRPSSFRVVSRTAAKSDAFARDLAHETGVPARGSASAREALEGAQAVLCATTSRSPVFEAALLAPDVYLATVGPKFGGANEVPEEVYARAALVFTDAPAQVADLEAVRGPLPAGRRASDLAALSDVVAGRRTCPRAGTRLFVSEGLAGTEPALLAALLGASAKASQAAGCVRPARADDAPRISALASAVWVGTYATEGVTAPIAGYVAHEFTSERVSAELGRAGRLAWVAEEGDGLVGYADVQLDHTTPDLGNARQAEVLRLYVHEAHTRRGVGTRLLRAACEAAFERDCEAVWLSVWARNDRAIRFYENAGWERRGDTVFRLEGVDHANRIYALRNPSAGEPRSKPA